MFIVVDQSGIVLGICEKTEQINNIKYVHIGYVPWVPKNSSATVLDENGELLTIYHCEVTK